MSSVDRKPWTRDELLVAMNVYDKLPFGHLDQSNPVIRDVARRMNRTPGSVAMKLCNLASLDPELRKRGRKGLDGASRLDRAVWGEFRRTPAELVPEGEDAFRRLFGAADTDEVEMVKGTGIRVRRRSLPGFATERETVVTVRRGQQFFRQMILNAFDGRCCISGLEIRELLIASHIVPWAADASKRLDVRNGLCLSALHDAAFDGGLIALDDDRRLVLGGELRARRSEPAIADNFARYEGRRIDVPDAAIGPCPVSIRYHRENVFRG